MCVKKIFSIFSSKPKAPAVPVVTATSGATEAELIKNQAALTQAQKGLADSQSAFAKQMQDWQTQRDGAAAAPPPLPAAALGATALSTAVDDEAEPGAARRGRKALRVPRSKTGPSTTGGYGLNIPS